MLGEDVIAVGSPFGFANTVTTGIISGVGREATITNGPTLTNLIQTSASINPGNSGGPLLNIDGEVIGINVGVREGAQGIAFALNADVVQQILSKQLSAQKMSGVAHGLACSELVGAEGVSRERLVLQDLGDNSPAAAAGLRRGDEVLRIAGRVVSNRLDLERALWDRKPGDKVEVVASRQGKDLTLTLTLGQSSDGERVAVKR